MEVVVALAILAVGLIVLLHTHAVNIDASNRSRALLISSMLVQQKLGETEIMGFNRLVDARGDFGDAHPGFVWERMVLGHPAYDDARMVTVKVYVEDMPSLGTELVTVMRKGE